MEIKIIYKEGKLEKEILYKNGRIKQFLYYKCRELIICKDLTLKGSPAVSVYPSMKSLVDKFNILKKRKILSLFGMMCLYFLEKLKEKRN